MNNLSAARQYTTSWLLRFDDELFGILYKDINNVPKELAVQVFEHERSVSIYGIRGIGKTALMQAILWHGLQSKNSKFLPINVGVVGANSAFNPSELEDKFYRQVLAGLLSASSLKDQHNKIKSIVESHAPWIAGSAVSTLGLIFPPIVIGSSITKKAVKTLLMKLDIPESKTDSLVINKEDIDPKMAVDFIIEQLKNNDVYPVFVIDELDKVHNDTILNEFFNGNQGWFQGKRTIISLSHTFGQSVEKK